MNRILKFRTQVYVSHLGWSVFMQKYFGDIKLEPKLTYFTFSSASFQPCFTLSLTNTRFTPTNRDKGEIRLKYYILLPPSWFYPYPTLSVSCSCLVFVRIFRKILLGVCLLSGIRILSGFLNKKAVRCLSVRPDKDETKVSGLSVSLSADGCLTLTSPLS